MVIKKPSQVLKQIRFLVLLKKLETLPLLAGFLNRLSGCSGWNDPTVSDHLLKLKWALCSINLSLQQRYLCNLCGTFCLLCQPGTAFSCAILYDVKQSYANHFCLEILIFLISLGLRNKRNPWYMLLSIQFWFPKVAPTGILDNPLCWTASFFYATHDVLSWVILFTPGRKKTAKRSTKPALLCQVLSTWKVDPRCLVYARMSCYWSKHNQRHYPANNSRIPSLQSPLLTSCLIGNWIGTLIHPSNEIINLLDKKLGAEFLIFLIIFLSKKLQTLDGPNCYAVDESCSCSFSRSQPCKSKAATPVCKARMRRTCCYSQNVPVPALLLQK